VKGKYKRITNPNCPELGSSRTTQEVAFLHKIKRHPELTAKQNTNRIPICPSTIDFFPQKILFSLL